MINYKSPLYKKEFEEQTALAKKKLLKKIIIGSSIGFLLFFLLILFGFITSEDGNEEKVQAELIVPYSGTIGKYNIHMTLNHTKGNGEYYYKSQGAENKLYLTILTDTLNQLVIEEKDVSDKVTGNFKGEFQNDSIYTGIFTNSKGKKIKFKLIAH